VNDKIDSDAEPDDAADEDEVDEPLVPTARPVEDLMTRLPELLSVRAVDAFALDFCHHFSKASRKRLIQGWCFALLCRLIWDRFSVG